MTHNNETEYYFVYGTLKRGYGNSERLFGTSKTAKFIKEVETAPKYTLLDLGAFPGVVEGGETAVKGELWEVSDAETKKRLDRLEGYRGKNDPNNLYNKDTIEIDDKPAIIYLFNRFTNFPLQTDLIVESGEWK